MPRIKVDIGAIDRAWDDLNLGHVDLMKINIEGAEFSLLDRMIKKDLLKCIDCFLTQFHEWQRGAQEKRTRIREELLKTIDWNGITILSGRSG